MKEVDVVVLGGGAGGYVAALRAAGLGREVVLVDDRYRPGGSCLLDGCIASKSLVFSVGLIQGTRQARPYGLTFENIRVNLDALRDSTSRHVDEMAAGIAGFLTKRGVQLVQGRGHLVDAHTLALNDGSTIGFRHAVLATGSRDEPIPVTGGLPVWYPSTAITIPGSARCRAGPARRA